MQPASDQHQRHTRELQPQPCTSMRRTLIALLACGATALQPSTQPHRRNRVARPSVRLCAGLQGRCGAREHSDECSSHAYGARLRLQLSGVAGAIVLVARRAATAGQQRFDASMSCTTGAFSKRSTQRVACKGWQEIASILQSLARSKLMTRKCKSSARRPQLSRSRLKFASSHQTA